MTVWMCICVTNAYAHSIKPGHLQKNILTFCSGEHMAFTFTEDAAWQAKAWSTKELSAAQLSSLCKQTMHRCQCQQVKKVANKCSSLTEQRKGMSSKSNATRIAELFVLGSFATKTNTYQNPLKTCWVKGQHANNFTGCFESNNIGGTLLSTRGPQSIWHVQSTAFLWSLWHSCFGMT